MRDTFIKYLQTVNRDGVDELIKKLDEWEFFTAPASGNHHCNHVGGLVEHSLHVLRYGLDLADVMGLPCTCLLYTSDACRRRLRCRSRWSPYH